MEERGKFALQKGTFMDIICMLVVVIIGKAACDVTQRPSNIYPWHWSDSGEAAYFGYCQWTIYRVILI